MKTVKRILTSFILITILLSCSSSDDEATPSKNCGDFINQEAKGKVKGFDFTNQGGTYTLMPNREYNCTIRTKEVTGGSCFFLNLNRLAKNYERLKFCLG